MTDRSLKTGSGYDEVLASDIFFKWLKKLQKADKKSHRAVLRSLDRLKDGQSCDTKYVGSEVYELRIFYGPGFRIYFKIEHGRILILLCAGDKSSQSADIRKAQKIARDWSH